MRRIISLLALVASVACSAPPDLGVRDSGSAGADFPTLVPLASLRAEAARQPAQDARQITDDITARMANLRARAQRLRGPVVDPVTKSRMRAAAARAALR